MAKILYEIKEVVEPETLRKIKVYEATTEKLKFLLDIENSTYSEREIGTQTEDLSETNLIDNLEENKKSLKKPLEVNLFINLIIFFQTIISLILFINYRIIKTTILKI
jgi:hypothetical protein